MNNPKIILVVEAFLRQVGRSIFCLEEATSWNPTSALATIWTETEKENIFWKMLSILSLCRTFLCNNCNSLTSQIINEYLFRKLHYSKLLTEVTTPAKGKKYNKRICSNQTYHQWSVFSYRFHKWVALSKLKECVG